MADKEISALTAATALTGAELIHTVQGGNSRKTTTGDIANLAKIAVQDEGSVIVADPAAINFTGGGVTVTDVGGVPTVNIPAAPATVPVQDEGSVVVATPTALNFTGAGVTVTNSSGVATIDIPSGGGGVGTPGTYTVSWKGAAASIVDAQINTTGAFTIIPLTAELIDTNNFLDIPAANNRFTIPSGVTKIRLTASIQSDSADAIPATNALAIYKNNGYLSPANGGFETPVPTAYANSGITVISGVLSVVAGDYFDLRVFQSATSRLDGYFQIEVLEGSVLAFSINAPVAYYNRVTATATAGQTTFSVGYTVGFVDVWLNGTKLAPSEFTATNGTSVVLASGAADGALFEAISWNVIPSEFGQTYDFGFVKVPAPSTSELLGKIVMPRSVDVPANFAGSVGHVDTNPSASFEISVTKNGSAMGTITISTSGVFTFATTGGLAVSLVSGDIVRFIAPASADATIAGIAATIKGSVA